MYNFVCISSIYLNMFALPVVAAAMILVIIALSALRFRRIPGVHYFSLTMFSGAVYTLFYALEISSNTFADAYLFYRLEYLGIPFFPAFSLLFSLTYTTSKSRVDWSLFALIFLIPILTVIFVFSNSSHHLFLEETHFDATGVFPTLAFNAGFWYWVQQAYSIFTITLSFILFFRMYIISAPAFRRQVLFILIGCFIPYMAYLIYLVGVFPENLDPIPFSFAIMGIIIYIGLYKYQLFDLVPHARNILFDIIPDPVIVLDNNERIIDFNRGASSLFNIEREQLGSNACVIFDYWPELCKVIKSSIIPKDGEIAFKDTGDSFCFRIAINQIEGEGNRSIGRMITLIDITEEKRAESQELSNLKKLKHRDTILEAVADISQIYLKNISFAEATNEVLAILGKAIDRKSVYLFEFHKNGSSKDQLLSLRYEWVKEDSSVSLMGGVLDSISISSHIQGWFEDLCKGRIVEKSLYETTGKVRETLAYLHIDEFVLVPVFVEKICWGAIGLDSSEEFGRWSEAEKAILEATASSVGMALQRELRLEELIAARQRAEESNRLKTAFLQNFSHEIRTPMNGILGFINFLEDPGTSIEERKEYFHIIKESSDRMLSTLNDIIEISKIEVGLVEPHLSKIDLRALLNDLVLKHAYEAKAKGLQFKVKFDETLNDKVLHSDQVMLWSILDHLLRNAIKYTPTGSVDLICQALSDGIQFRIKDTGIGIAKERHEMIFDRFVQADVSSTRAFEGVGLGLSIVKAYVELLGSQITLDSKLNQGSEFVFVLPWSLPSK